MRGRATTSGLPEFRGPELACHVEDAAVHQGKVAVPDSLHKYLCHRWWKLHFCRRSGDLKYQMALSELIWLEKRVMRGPSAGPQKTKSMRRRNAHRLIDRIHVGLARKPWQFLIRRQMVVIITPVGPLSAKPRSIAGGRSVFSDLRNRLCGGVSYEICRWGGGRAKRPARQAVAPRDISARRGSNFSKIGRCCPGRR